VTSMFTIYSQRSSLWLCGEESLFPDEQGCLNRIPNYIKIFNYHSDLKVSIIFDGLAKQLKNILIY
jgi:hypothetical protein